MRLSAAAGQRTGPIHPAESFVPAKTFREKEILPTSSGGEGENDIRKDVRPRDDSSKAEGDKARRADFGPSRAKSGTTELRTHPEFGVNLSETPVRFAFLCLRAIPQKGSPAGFHSLRLCPAIKKDAVSPSPTHDKPSPGRKTHIPHLTTPSAGRPGCVLTCLTKFLFLFRRFYGILFKYVQM